MLKCYDIRLLQSCYTKFNMYGSVNKKINDYGVWTIPATRTQKCYKIEASIIPDVIFCSSIHIFFLKRSICIQIDYNKKC